MNQETMELLGIASAEQAVVGGLLINPTALDDVLEILTTGDFLDKKHRIIVEASVSLSQRGTVADIVAVAEELNRSGTLAQAGGPAYLAELAENSTGTGNIRAYARLVADVAQRRQLASALHESSQAVFAPPLRPVEELANEAMAAIGNIERGGSSGLAPIAVSLKNWLTQLNDIESGAEIRRVYTGLQCLDDRWDGLRPGELIILGGTRGTGKTALALQIAAEQSAHYSKRALVFSLEMPAEQCAMRCAGALGRLPVWMAESKDPTARAEFYARHAAALSVAVAKLKAAPLEIDDQGGTHISTLMSRARKAHRRQPVDLIVVDYLQLLNGEGHNRENQVAMISRSLKALAKELECPVLALTQLNREGKARESDGIENDADIVCKLFREDSEGQDTLNPGLCEARTSKLRRGQVGVDLLHAKLAHYRMDMWTGAVREEEPARKRYQSFEG